MAFRRSRAPRGGAAKRQVTWIGPADQSYIAVANATKVLIASFTPGGVGIDKPTLVRSRGTLSVRPSSVAADLSYTGAFGMGVVSDQALAIGITAIPGPFDDADWDGWFVWQSFSGRVEFEAGIEAVLAREIEYDIDSKAMRKVSDNNSIVLVGESQTGSVSMSAPIRLLLKLS